MQIKLSHLYVDNIMTFTFMAINISKYILGHLNTRKWYNKTVEMLYLVATQYLSMFSCLNFVAYVKTSIFDSSTS